MNQYVDFHLRPNPEIPTYQLLGALYSRLHHALVRLNTADIGVSFPRFDAAFPYLGDQLRLHGTAASLGELIGTGWLHGLRDYVDRSAVFAVPPTAMHRRILRVQAKSSPERLRRRAMRRHGLDADTARLRIPDTVAETLRLPYVEVGSRSTGQTFRIFIQHGPLQAAPAAGGFNAYGLSKEATIPWF